MAVEVDVAEFESIDDLDVHFKKLLRKAPDEETEAQIRTDMKDAQVAWYQQSAAKAQLDVARRDALDKFPLARPLAAEIRGNTPAAIEESAKRIHEAFEAAQQTSQQTKQKAADDDATARATAQAAYGVPAGAGTGTPLPPALEDMEAIKQRTWKKLGEGKGMQDAQSKMDFPRFASARLREGVEQSQTNPSYRSFGRNSPDDRKNQDDRTARAKPIR